MNIYIEECVFRQQVIIQTRTVCLKTKRRKRSNRKFQNKTLQIIKTVKTPQPAQNYITHDDDQKYDQKRLGRRYGTIFYDLDSDTRKITSSLKK